LSCFYFGSNACSVFVGGAVFVENGRFCVYLREYNNIDMVIFSKHAKEQMLRRGITHEAVMSVITHPEEILADDEDPTVMIFQSLIKENNRWFLLRVFINKDKATHEIITLYKTSKIQKYYEGKIR
jgi:hypothetical protein